MVGAGGGGMQLWALTLVAKHAAPNIHKLYKPQSPALSPAAPASRHRAAQPTAFLPSATTRHDASRTGSYSEKLIPSAHIRILAWRRRDGEREQHIERCWVSQRFGSAGGSVVRPSVAMNLVWTLVGGRPKHTCCDSLTSSPTSSNSSSCSPNT